MKFHLINRRADQEKSKWLCDIWGAQCQSNAVIDCWCWGNPGVTYSKFFHGFGSHSWAGWLEVSFNFGDM